VVYAGGWFKNIGGEARSNLAALDLDAARATGWAPEPNDAVTTVAAGGGLVYAGGLFSQVGGLPRRYAVALDATSAIVTDWAPDPDDFVDAIVPADTTVFMSGYFNSVGGSPRDAVGAVSARSGLATDWIANADREVKAIAISDGIVYVGGGFSSIGGKSRLGVAALSQRTGEVLDWDAGTDGVVWSLGAGEGHVFVGGRFRRVGVAPSGLIASIVGPGSPPVPPPGSGGILQSVSATNPANSSAMVRFTLTVPSDVELRTLDLQGRLVRPVIRQEAASAGPHVLLVNTGELPPGCYLCKLSTTREYEIRKLVVVH
jgi:hypothetical protein